MVIRKGKETRVGILTQAIREVSVVGLDGLSIGALAKKTGLSKSGLFAHFESKEELQIQILDFAAETFVADVVMPALKKPRGEPRIRALFQRWLTWAFGGHLPGGCIFLSAATELDDKPGALRSHLQHSQERWIATLARSAALAKDEHHFDATLDTQQFAFELYGIMMASHFYGRLLNSQSKAKAHARAAFDRLLSHAAAKAH